MKHDSPNADFFQRHGMATSGIESTRWAASPVVSRDRSAATPGHLTPRQLEVLALLCEGLPNKLICRRLNIATGTVKVHISCILRELGVTSRLQAVVMARACGLPELLESRGSGEGDPVADVVAH